jgi:hypothetical protein
MLKSVTQYVGRRKSAKGRRTRVLTLYVSKRLNRVSATTAMKSAAALTSKRSSVPDVSGVRDTVDTPSTSSLLAGSAPPVAKHSTQRSVASTRPVSEPVTYVVESGTVVAAPNTTPAVLTTAERHVPSVVPVMA